MLILQVNDKITHLIHTHLKFTDSHIGGTWNICFGLMPLKGGLLIG